MENRFVQWRIRRIMGFVGFPSRCLSSYQKKIFFPLKQQKAMTLVWTQPKTQNSASLTIPIHSSFLQNISQGLRSLEISDPFHTAFCRVHTSFALGGFLRRKPRKCTSCICHLVTCPVLNSAACYTILYSKYTSNNPNINHQMETNGHSL